MFSATTEEKGKRARKKKTSIRKIGTGEEHKKYENSPFYHQNSRKIPSLAWAGGYAQLSVQVEMQRETIHSMIFAGPISDWIGVSEDVAFNYRRGEWFVTTLVIYPGT